MPPVIGLGYMALKINAKMCKVMYVHVLHFSLHNCHAFWIKRLITGMIFMFGGWGGGGERGKK